MRIGFGKFLFVAPVVVAALLVGSSSAYAQEGLGFQILGGPLFANVTDASGFDTSAKSGFLVGAGIGGNRGGNVGVEVDILYGKKKTEISSSLATSDFQQSLIDVPIMAKINLGSKSASGARGFVHVGGYFDWQFDSKVGVFDVSESTDGFEAGLVFGGGVEFARISVQGRYYKGLRNIDRTFNVGSSVESKSQGVAILFGFRAN